MSDLKMEDNQNARVRGKREQETRLWSRKCWVLLLAAVATVMAGCATPDTARQEARPGSGIVEYRQIVGKASKAMAKAIAILDRVGAQTNRCPPRLVVAFSREVQRLQADSLKARARSQAIQARGEAYFENWEENLSSVKDPRVRELARAHHPQLQECFGRIKVSSRQVGEAFRPFLDGLRKLQNALETDPGSVGADATRDLIRTTREEGAQVEKALANIGRELQSMTEMLTPAPRSARP